MSIASAIKSHQQATFKVQADAQLKAWREAADQLGIDAKKFAADRLDEIDAAVNRMTTPRRRKTPEVERGGDPVMVRTYGCFDGNALHSIAPIRWRWRRSSELLDKVLIGFGETAARRSFFRRTFD